MGRSWPEGTNSVIILTGSRNLMYSTVTIANNTVSYTIMLLRDDLNDFTTKQGGVSDRVFL